jgi:hypothetical protein
VRKVLTRLLPLAVVGVGLFFWRGGGGVFAADRELIWRVPGPYSTVRKVEVQVYDGDELLKREEWNLPNGLTLDPTDKVPLREGSYQTNLLVWRDTGAQSEAYKIPLEIEGNGPFVLQPGNGTRR